MSGRVVKQVIIPHECAPGWTWKPITEGSGIPPLIPGATGGKYGVPPAPHQCPAGTVWRCDCGTHWVSRGPVDEHGHMVLGWRRESRRERRRRLGLRWWQKETK